VHLLCGTNVTIIVEVHVYDHVFLILIQHKRYLLTSLIFRVLVHSHYMYKFSVGM